MALRIDRSRPCIEYRRERPSDDGARRSPVAVGTAVKRLTEDDASGRLPLLKLPYDTDDLAAIATRHPSCAAMRPTWSFLASADRALADRRWRN